MAEFSLPTNYKYDFSKGLTNYGTDTPLGTNYSNLSFDKELPTSSFLKNSMGNINPITQEPKTFLGLEQGTWGGLGAAGQLLGGAIGAYTGLENLGLARKALDYNMAMGDKQYAMAKDAYDRNVARAEHIGNQMNRSAKTVGEANV
jgi:hypothetical protein